MSLQGHNKNTIWVSLHTKGSGDPSSGCICSTVGTQVSVIESYSACLHLHIVWSFLYRFTSRESYLSQTEQWWHRSGFSNWQRSQKRIAEETQAVQSHSRQQQQQRQQQPLHTLDHRLTSWRGWNELWGPHISPDCSCCSHHINCTLYCTVPPELVRVYMGRSLAILLRISCWDSPRSSRCSSSLSEWDRWNYVGQNTDDTTNNTSDLSIVYLWAVLFTSNELYIPLQIQIVCQIS